MTAREAVVQAWQSLGDHGFRAWLSAIGVLFGVATVVAALAVGEGARRKAYDDVAALGIDNVFLKTTPPAPGYPAPPRFTPADAEAIARAAGAGVVVASLRRARGEMHRGPIFITAEIAGVTPAWSRIADLELVSGRWLDAADTRERRRVVAVSTALAQALFGAEDPLGNYVRWREYSLRVVGVVAPGRRAGGLASAYVPISVADVRLGPQDDGRLAQEIALRTSGEAGAEPTAVRAADVLVDRGHRRDAVEVVVPRALLKARLRAQRTFDWVLYGIGGLALLISGIGIMNIMLASVAARAMEIGVRRAAGARRRDVLAQFAAEAGILCAAGGAAGLPVGALAAALIASGADWPVSISVGTVVLALAMAVFVASICGIYPAYRAARLDPVAALRA